MGKKSKQQAQHATPVVTGWVVIPATISAFTNATIHLYLEEITHADSGAKVIAERAIPGVSHNPPSATGIKELKTGIKGPNKDKDEPDATIILFTLDVAREWTRIDPHRAYTVRVWVDLDSKGEREEGDLFSDQAYRVLTQGSDDTVSITLGLS